MFDFRYHALSLTAVIVALVLGVLLGVAIGDRGLVSSADKGLKQDLRHAIASAQSHADDLQSQLNDRLDVLDNGVYPLLVANRMAGDNVGILFLGPKSKTDKQLITDAVGTAGGHPAWLLAFKEPLDATGIAGHATGTQYARLGDDPSLYAKLGVRVGAQLVTGGRLIRNERAPLSDSFDGKLVPVSTIVLVRDTPTDLDRQQQATVNQFENGVVSGLSGAGATIVGIQTQTTMPSQTSWYRNQGLTYVSDLDQVEGQISLIYGLTGCSGQFGHGSGEQPLPDPQTCG